MISAAGELVLINPGEDYTNLLNKIYAIQCLKTNTSDVKIKTLYGSEVIFPVGSFIKGAVYNILISEINYIPDTALFMGYITLLNQK